jgi:hypothetical protein
VFSHLSKTRDTWEDFLFRNNFTLPENAVESPLHINKNPILCIFNPAIKNPCVDSQEDHATIDRTSVAIQNPLGKNPRCDFMPRKSLEEVLDVLKDRVPFVPTVEPIGVVPNELVIKKNRRHKEHSNFDLNFSNKRLGMLISRILRNRQRYHLSLIPVIEVNDDLSKDEIDEFLV